MSKVEPTQRALDQAAHDDEIGHLRSRNDELEAENAKLRGRIAHAIGHVVTGETDQSVLLDALDPDASPPDSEPAEGAGEGTTVKQEEWASAGIWPAVIWDKDHEAYWSYNDGCTPSQYHAHRYTLEAAMNIVSQRGGDDLVIVCLGYEHGPFVKDQGGRFVDNSGEVFDSTQRQDAMLERRDSLQWDLDWMFKAAQHYFDHKGWDKSDLHRVHGSLRRALADKPVPTERRDALEALDELRAGCSHPPTDGGWFDERYRIIRHRLTEPRGIDEDHAWKVAHFQYTVNKAPLEFAVRTAVRSALAEPAVPEAVNVVFDGPPGPNPPHFVEVETDYGRSVRVGEWIERNDGMWALRIDRAIAQSEQEAK